MAMWSVVPSGREKNQVVKIQRLGSRLMVGGNPG